MSALSSLRPKKGATHRKRRIGRGDASGWGGTAAKGHKGQKARKSGGIPRGFEGGQSPVTRRLPKFGFSNRRFTTRYEIVNLRDLEKLTGDVTPETLAQAGLVGKGLVKILGDGELSKSLNVTAHKFSESAKAAIEKAGGSTQLIEAKAKSNNEAQQG